MYQKALEPKQERGASPGSTKQAQIRAKSVQGRAAPTVVSGMFDNSGVQIQEAGEALYGPLWQTALASALGITVRQAQRYAAGISEPPPERWRQIADLMRARQAELSELITRIGY